MYILKWLETSSLDNDFEENDKNNVNNEFLSKCNCIECVNLFRYKKIN